MAFVQKLDIRVYTEERKYCLGTLLYEDPFCRVCHSLRKKAIRNSETLKFPNKASDLHVKSPLTLNCLCLSNFKRVMAEDDESKPLNPLEFACSQLKLLDKERLAEVAEVSDAITTFSPTQLQIRGLAVLNLTIASVRTGLGGKTYISEPHLG